MPRLVLINGAPGSGKSTLARALAQDGRFTLALDLDGIKHSLGRWQEDPIGAGLHARRLGLALAAEHLRTGHDVVLGQYLARSEFIETLESHAGRCRARFVEVVLDVDVATLADRLVGRTSRPTLPEHLVNNALVGPEDAPALVASIEALRAARPGALWVDARGSLEQTLDRVRAALPAGD